MKALTRKLSVFGMLLLFSSFGMAQEDWPKVINASDGTIIKMYQPEPESFASNILKFRSAISVTEPGRTDPIFGTFWATSKVQTDRDNRQVAIESLSVTDIKIPAETDANKVDFIKTTLESQIPQAVGQIPLDELLASLDQNQEQAKLSNNISTKPPKVIYATQPSILVFIDGAPKLQNSKEWGVDVVVNSPFSIIKNTDNQFYLFGGNHWYVAPSATGPYSYISSVPSNLTSIQDALSKNNPNTENSSNGSPAANGNDNVISNIIVTNTPAELIQSKGEANFSPIEGTGLLYVKNSDNDIFMDLNSQMYFVLISGRWYRSKALGSNQWDYIGADKLPGDFSKIPEGSAKDNVLASVAGTDAAREAVMDAQIPQTAKIDRNSATTTVTYNGDPQFEPIEGTDLQYAVNTSSTVLRYKGLYYAVDNGVWFVSDYPAGPWAVATDRPDEVDLIPPSYPVYNTKYVYVYDVTPDYVYMGYTPGYLNSYVYGPTIVYGTGYYYNPWWGGYYYPRPWSWGFNIGYNPWYGWSFGFGYSWGWFNAGYGFWGGFYHGGWWGPAIYHPAYCGWGWGYHPYGGYYGHNVYVNHNVYNNIRVNNTTNNIYRGRGGVSTRDNRPQIASSARQGNNFSGNRPATNAYNNRQNFNNTTPNSAGRPNAQTGSGRPNNVFSDRQGNVYQRSAQGWQQRSNRSWAPVDNTQRPDVVRGLDRQQQMRDRGQMRVQNFQSARSGFSSARPSAPAPRSMSSGGGGGGRPSGGGGGGGRPGRR